MLTCLFYKISRVIFIERLLLITLSSRIFITSGLVSLRFLHTIIYFALRTQIGSFMMYPGCISMQIFAKSVYLYSTGYWWYMSKLWHGIQFETNDILRYSLMVPEGEAWQFFSFNHIGLLVFFLRSASNVYT